MPVPKEGQPTVRIDMPHRTQEFLDLVGDPNKAIRDIVEFGKKAKNYDPSPDTKLILPKAS